MPRSAQNNQTGHTGNVNVHDELGWECLHNVELLIDDRGLTVAGFLRRALQ